MSVVLIFIDGLGIGDGNPDKNPCNQGALTQLGNYYKKGKLHTSSSGKVVPLDAMLDIEGLPQSATGQTALLTGINAAKHLGRHLQGFPNQSLRDLLKEYAVIKKIKELGFRPAFINAYRSEFFKLPEGLKWRMSVTTVANLAAELPFMTLDDLKRGRALYHDFTNKFLVQKGFDVPLFSPEHAGSILANLTQQYDFVLYEYFMTDKIGHSQNMTLAMQEILNLDQFLEAFLLKIDLEKNSVILTSDHGNIEDLSVKSHTKNSAMTILWGKDAVRLSSGMASIQDVTPAILEVCLNDHD